VLTRRCDHHGVQDTFGKRREKTSRRKRKRTENYSYSRFFFLWKTRE